MNCACDDGIPYGFQCCRADSDGSGLCSPIECLRTRFTAKLAMTPIERKRV
jgi:hypothetical protein